MKFAHKSRLRWTCSEEVIMPAAPVNCTATARWLKTSTTTARYLVPPTCPACYYQGAGPDANPRLPYGPSSCQELSSSAFSPITLSKFCPLLLLFSCFNLSAFSSCDWTSRLISFVYLTFWWSLLPRGHFEQATKTCLRSCNPQPQANLGNPTYNSKEIKWFDDNPKSDQFSKAIRQPKQKRCNQIQWCLENGSKELARSKGKWSTHPRELVYNWVVS